MSKGTLLLSCTTLLLIADDRSWEHVGSTGRLYWTRTRSQGLSSRDVYYQDKPVPPKQYNESPHRK